MPKWRDHVTELNDELATASALCLLWVQQISKFSPWRSCCCRNGSISTRRQERDTQDSLCHSQLPWSHNASQGNQHTLKRIQVQNIPEQASKFLWLDCESSSSSFPKPFFPPSDISETLTPKWKKPQTNKLWRWAGQNTLPKRCLLVLIKPWQVAVSCIHKCGNKWIRISAQGPEILRSIPYFEWVHITDDTEEATPKDCSGETTQNQGEKKEEGRKVREESRGSNTQEYFASGLVTYQVSIPKAPKNSLNKTQFSLLVTQMLRCTRGS